MNTNVKKFLTHIEQLDVIPPANGENYIGNNNQYHVGEGEVVRLNEKQVNLATIMANEPNTTEIDAIVRAGYTLQPSTIAKMDSTTPLARIKNNFRQKFRNAYVANVQKLQHFIQRDAAKTLGLDAAWVLGQQVALFEECKRAKNYTNAVRLLDSISMHVTIDSRVSNRLEITDTVDYASLLSQADNRTNQPALKNTDEVVGLPSIIEGEVLVIEDMSMVEH